MMFDREKALDELLRFVRAHDLSRANVTAQTDLIESGLMDSLLLVDLIVHLEEVYGVRFESEHIDPTNFNNIAAIVDLVAQRMAAAEPRLG